MRKDDREHIPQPTDTDQNQQLVGNVSRVARVGSTVQRFVGSWSAAERRRLPDRVMRLAWQQIADIERAAQAGDGKRSLAGGGRGLSPFGSLAHPLGPRLPGEPVGSDEMREDGQTLDTAIGASHS